MFEASNCRACVNADVDYLTTVLHFSGPNGPLSRSRIKL